MSTQLFLSILLTLTLQNIHATDVFHVSFEEGEGITTGPLEAQNGWSSEKYSQGEGTVSVVKEGDNSTPAPAEGSQQLALVRPSTSATPGAGIIFRPLDQSLQTPFEFSYHIALKPRSGFPSSLIQLGDSTSGANGIFSGIRMFQEDRRCYLFAIDGAEAVKLNADPESDELSPITPGQYYRVVIAVSPETGTYGIKVFANGRLAGSRENLHIAHPPAGYNRILATVPGGTSDDTMYLDDLAITMP